MTKDPDKKLNKVILSQRKNQKIDQKETGIKKMETL